MILLPLFANGRQLCVRWQGYGEACDAAGTACKNYAERCITAAYDQWRMCSFSIIYYLESLK